MADAVVELVAGSHGDNRQRVSLESLASYESLGDLLESHRPVLLRLAQRQLHGSIARRVDAGDMVQETFLAAHRDIRSFRGSTLIEFGGWLKAILMHRLRSAVSSHQSGKRDIRREVAFEGGHWESIGPPAELERRECLQALRSALAQLPARYAEIIHLREYQQLPYARIRECLGVTEQLARVRHVRALRMLRQKLRADPLFKSQ